MTTKNFLRSLIMIVVVTAPTTIYTAYQSQKNAAALFALQPQPVSEAEEQKCMILTTGPNQEPDYVVGPCT